MTSEKSYDTQQRLDAHLNNHLFTNALSGNPSMTASMQTFASAVLTPGFWRVQGQILINSTSSGGTLAYRVHASGGLVISTCRVSFVELNGTSVGVADFRQDESTQTGSVVGSGLADRVVTMSGRCDVSVAGTFNFQASLSSGAANIYQFGSYLDAWQML